MVNVKYFTYATIYGLCDGIGGASVLNLFITYALHPYLVSLYCSNS